MTQPPSRHLRDAPDEAGELMGDGNGGAATGVCAAGSQLAEEQRRATRCSSWAPQHQRHRRPELLRSAPGGAAFSWLAGKSHHATDCDPPRPKTWALYFATTAVHTPDGTVGHELFVGHVLTFDFLAHHFWMS